jgi:hypothetical protein
MKISVIRDVSNDKVTLSRVLIDGKQECFGLEDEFRSVKVAGDTRIPAGTYPLRLRKEGRYHAKYVAKFSWHLGMLHVRDVPGFEFILIHIGNNEKDTEGCLLVGKARDYKTMTISSSAVAYEAFYKKVVKEVIKGGVTIEYIDKDREPAKLPEVKPTVKKEVE